MLPEIARIVDPIENVDLLADRKRLFSAELDVRTDLRSIERREVDDGDSHPLNAAEHLIVGSRNLMRTIAVDQPGMVVVAGAPADVAHHIATFRFEGRDRGQGLLAARVLASGNDEEGKDAAKRHRAHNADNGEGRLAL